ncbi:hypothetical protein NO932_04695 [Pelagibacterium sp. 26DY04]|uniref:hypothetical protein n=1 Tax=unclassified Pelagibacterium TaxID=2623280 RepID=UPI0028165283|nr:MULTISPECIES: hypothetical protein [unclassified Pelagibacterium]WMT87909.1 hypothetical protein NO932_04695 [Pelagibacterium sp. 26DY04]WMT91322.1 hypothetical protein NO934_03410 [Pelagibacterium sp. H642]
MTKPIVISVAGEPQGVVVPNGTDFRFMAVKLGVFPLDGKIFESIEAARAAAEAVVEDAASLAGSFKPADGGDEGMVA